MSRASLRPMLVGNEFVLPAQPLRVATPLAAPESISIPVIETAAETSIPVSIKGHHRLATLSQGWELLHRYSLATFALLFLLVGSAGIQVGSSYVAARTNNRILSAPVAKPVINGPSIGQTMLVKADKLAVFLQTTASQPASITIGGQVVPISPDDIKSWVKVTPNSNKSMDHLFVDPEAITASLKNMTDKYVKAPVNQVTVTHTDGTSAIISAGHDGVKLTNPDDLKQQAAIISKTLMANKGISFNAPTETQAFAAVTPTAFDKLIEVNVVTKQMYLYDHGQLWKSYPISAGAAATPTPLGQYQIYQKLPVQDMRGYNADGTKYFQPHVRWINYFLPGGYAVHGNYWRPLSWFGAVNSSHGCVSLPDDQAKEVYDWAPIGTTVITHT